MYISFNLVTYQIEHYSLLCPNFKVNRMDILDRDALELNFLRKFETLNRVHLTDSEFNRLRDEIVNADVFIASKTYANEILFNARMAHHCNTHW